MKTWGTLLEFCQYHVPFRKFNYFRFIKTPFSFPVVGRHRTKSTLHWTSRISMKIWSTLWNFVNITLHSCDIPTSVSKAAIFYFPGDGKSYGLVSDWFSRPFVTYCWKMTPIIRQFASNIMRLSPFIVYFPVGTAVFQEYGMTYGCITFHIYIALSAHHSS